MGLVSWPAVLARRAPGKTRDDGHRLQITVCWWNENAYGSLWSIDSVHMAYFSGHGPRNCWELSRWIDHTSRCVRTNRAARHQRDRADGVVRYAQDEAELPARLPARPSDGISIYGLPMMCRWAERVPAHIIYAPVSL